MTKEAIKEHCKKMKLYLTPHLNDVLYLHFKGKSARGYIAVKSVVMFLRLLISKYGVQTLLARGQPSPLSSPVTFLPQSLLSSQLAPDSYCGLLG
jgi:hypothetical protein